MRLILADYIRDIAPGELVVIDKTGVGIKYLPQKGTRFCIFEYIYFARPDSIFADQFIRPEKKLFWRAKLLMLTLLSQSQILVCQLHLVMRRQLEFHLS